MSDDAPRPVATLVDPRRPTFATFIGKKHSGKSHLAARFWDSWPFDRLAVDPMHDAEVGADVKPLETPLPGSWPWSLKGDDDRVSLHYRPDSGSATFADDLDRAVGLAMTNRKRKLVWLDEVGLHTRANATRPAMRRALHTGRHYDLSLLMCCPRPIDIDPLVMSQADYVYVFKLPNPNDRRRVADCIGYDPGAFDDAVHGLGQFEYLRYSSADDELLHLPAIPGRTLEIPRADH